MGIYILRTNNILTGAPLTEGEEHRVPLLGSSGHQIGSGRREQRNPMTAPGEVGMGDSGVTRRIPIGRVPAEYDAYKP